MFPAEREQEGPGLAIAVGLAHYHRALVNRATGEIRQRCSRVVREGIPVRVVDVWNMPQPFKATYCARCDRGSGIPSRSAQLLYLRSDVMKRLGGMNEEAVGRLDANCLAAWRLGDEPWMHRSTFDVMERVLNRSAQERRWPSDSLWELTRAYSHDELHRSRNVSDGGCCIDYMPAERTRTVLLEPVGALVAVDHA